MNHRSSWILSFEFSLLARSDHLYFRSMFPIVTGILNVHVDFLSFYIALVVAIVRLVSQYCRIQQLEFLRDSKIELRRKCCNFREGVFLEVAAEFHRGYSFFLLRECPAVQQWFLVRPPKGYPKVSKSCVTPCIGHDHQWVHQAHRESYSQEAALFIRLPPRSVSIVCDPFPVSTNGGYDTAIITRRILGVNARERLQTDRTSLNGFLFGHRVLGYFGGRKFPVYIGPFQDTGLVGGS